jgi:crotonobetainyl-CoA:carnitine CoA-transferase CaiB-like acyl-CoA transferase
LNENNTMLAPYRVLDLTDDKGVYAGYLLGAFGADVVKVEPPGGDTLRDLAPFLRDEPGPDRGYHWLAYNVNKRGITLDITQPKGRELFLELAKGADVVLESFQPGYLAKLGLGYDELSKVNPKLVLTTVTPFGPDGPYADYQSSDLVCWALGGLLAQTGDPDGRPVRVSQINFSYLLAGMDAAWGTALALYWRGTSGQGQHVDVAIQASVAKTTFLSHESWEVTGREQARASSFYRVHNSEVRLKQVWECKDGHIAFLIFGGSWGATHDNPRMVQWLEEAGMADDFISNLKWAELNWRKTPLDEVDKIHGYFGRFFASKTKDELLTGALERRIALQPINTPVDIVKHPQLKVRDYWRQLPEPGQAEPLTYPGRFCLPSEAPCVVRRHAPKLGEHNAEIFGEIGRTQADIDGLLEVGIL